jgi:mannose/cellobiose epimerase-like protein (N-acyl-D-glucosamine 2-epimerase family)
MMRQMAVTMRGRACLSLQVEAGARTGVLGLSSARCYSAAAGAAGIDCEHVAALGEHFEKTMEFHLAVDFDATHGGYFQQITREGAVLDHVNRNLNNTTRGVYTYALAAKTFADSNPDLAQRCVEGSRHGVSFLQEKHRLADGSYAGDLRCEDGKTEVVDATKLCYGHGFVLLALSGAHMVGAAERSDVEGIWELLESRFYRPEDKLYVDEIDADGWDGVSPYRGQNANMHMTEAMLCAFEATRDEKYLARARSLSHRICVGLASQAEGSLVWEHFGEDWTIDYEYNLDDKQHLIRPWGFLPGHSAEWAKLLCILHRLQPDTEKEDWIIPGGHTCTQRPPGTPCNLSGWSA